MTNYRQQITATTGYFGDFGGAYVPEVLRPVMRELAAAFDAAVADPTFAKELTDLSNNFAGRPTPLVACPRLTAHAGGAQIYIKNEGLLHTGAHKLNHCLGQVLLAKRMGKTRIIAETGAGQHGVATATVCAKFGIECIIYMGAKDFARQKPNVLWMQRLGAKVIPVTTGNQTLRDAVNEAMRDLIKNPSDTLYLLGTVCGPDPYPRMNTHFQKVISEELRGQIDRQIGKLPTAMVTCVGGGSNAMGFFYDFLDEPDVRLIGVEAGGHGIGVKDGNATHSARFAGGRVGISEGMKSYFLQDENGQLMNTHSISAGLDYSGVGPQIAFLKEAGRLEVAYAEDDRVIDAHALCMRLEGINPALESAHGVAHGLQLAATLTPEDIVICHASGRGEKDLFITAPYIDNDGWKAFLQDYQNTL